MPSCVVSQGHLLDNSIESFLSCPWNVFEYVKPFEFQFISKNKTFIVDYRDLFAENDKINQQILLI